MSLSLGQILSFYTQDLIFPFFTVRTRQRKDTSNHIFWSSHSGSILSHNVYWSRTQCILSNTLNISIKFWRLYTIGNRTTCSCLHKRTPMQIFSPPIPLCPHSTLPPLPPPPSPHTHLFKTKWKKKNNPKENFFKIKWLTSAGSEKFNTLSRAIVSVMNSNF